MLTNAVRSCVVIVAVAGTFLMTARAGAQQSCSALPNPIIVVGSGDFEPMLTELGAKLADESPPATLITAASSSLATSCGGIAGVIGSTDLGDQVGRYHVQSGSAITTNTCIFAAGQTPHVAISDVFYETCAALPQPKPADVVERAAGGGILRGSDRRLLSGPI